MTSPRQRPSPTSSPSPSPSSLYPPSTSSFPFGSSSPSSFSSSASSSSSLTAGAQPLPSPPLLRLNGIPISAPTAAAFPPPSPRSSRSRNSMSSRKSGSGSSGNATLGPAGHGSGKKGRTSSHSSSRRAKGSSGRTAIRRKNAMPNPVLSPFDFLSWLRWRWSVWVQATFSVGMLTDWETVLLSIVTFLLALVILYALFFQFPVTVRMVIRRASYYLYGSSAGAAPGGVQDPFLGSVEPIQ